MPSPLNPRYATSWSCHVMLCHEILTDAGQDYVCFLLLYIYIVPFKGLCPKGFSKPYCVIGSDPVTHSAGPIRGK